MELIYFLIVGLIAGVLASYIMGRQQDLLINLLIGIVGAVVFGYLEPTLRSLLLSGGPGKLTFDQVAHVPFWAVALGVAAVLATSLAVLERLQSWRAEVGPDVDGLAAANGRPAPSADASRLSSASA